MDEGKWEPRMVCSNPDLFVMEWVPNEGPRIRDGVEMTEQELRAALGTKWSRSGGEIEYLIEKSRSDFAA